MTTAHVALADVVCSRVTNTPIKNWTHLGPCVAVYVCQGEGEVQGCEALARTPQHDTLACVQGLGDAVHPSRDEQGTILNLQVASAGASNRLSFDTQLQIGFRYNTCMQLYMMNQ
jgi:hypothetical protein